VNDKQKTDDPHRGNQHARLALLESEKKAQDQEMAQKDRKIDRLERRINGENKRRLLKVWKATKRIRYILIVAMMLVGAYYLVSFSSYFDSTDLNKVAKIIVHKKYSLTERKVANLEPIKNDNSKRHKEFYRYGDLCYIEEGGELRVVGIYMDKVLTRYSKNGKLKYSECPNGTLLYFSKTNLFEMIDYSKEAKVSVEKERIRKEKQNIATEIFLKKEKEVTRGFLEEEAKGKVLEKLLSESPSVK